MQHASSGDILMRMLTRAQVAKRLGRSIATVRRLEGVALHPTRDPAGIHRFDDDEVQAVAGRMDDAGLTVALPSSMTEPDEGTSLVVARLQDDVTRLQVQLSEAEARTREAQRALDAHRRRTAGVLLTLGRELAELDERLVPLVIAAAEELDAR
jgi:hypothetical protein